MKHKLLTSTVWVASSRMLVRLLGLFSVLFVVRLLTPADFGLVAVVMSIIGILEAFSKFGFTHALIHYKNANDQDYNTAWTLNLIRGIVICLLLIICAYPLSLALDEPRYFLMLVVVSIVPLIQGLENARFTEFEKDLNFSKLFYANVFSKIFAVVSTISLAIWLGNYWVLIIGMIVNAMFKTLFTFIYTSSVPKFTLKSFKKLFSFSGWLFGSELLGAINAKADPLILTSVFNAPFVGIIHLAREVSSMLNEFSAPLRRVLFPALSQLDKNSQEFTLRYSKGVAGLFFIMAPFCFGLALIAPRLVPLVFGDGWYEVIEFIQLFALLIGVTIIGRAAQSAIMATGDTRIFFYRSLVFLPLRMSLVIGLSLAMGKHGLMIAFAINTILICLVNIGVVSRTLGIGYLAHLKMTLPYIPGILLMLLIGNWFIANTIMPEPGYLDDILVIGLTIVFSGIAYYSLVFGIWSVTGRPDGPLSIVHEEIRGIVTKIKTRYANNTN